VTEWRGPASGAFTPESDTEAAACVTHKAEQRPTNVPFNRVVPTQAQLERFRAEVQFQAPVARFVTGQAALYLTEPSTDDLIQWGACKWGIPTEWLRALYVAESTWYQALCLHEGKQVACKPEAGYAAIDGRGFGDKHPETASQLSINPVFAVSGGEAFQSLGIAQVKWVPASFTDLITENPHPGTEPLRWESTAFNIDYNAAMLRYYYDGQCSWCTSGYGAGQQWNTIGAWYSPYPWNNSSAQWFIGLVQGKLSSRPWTSPSW
jgi:hypothetical protein